MLDPAFRHCLHALLIGLAFLLEAGAAAALPPLRPTTPAFRFFTERDGLPQNTVRGVTFDARGCVWAATGGGIAYDCGREWVTLPLPPDLKSDVVTSLAFDPDGSLWAGTGRDGLLRYRDGAWELFDDSASPREGATTSVVVTTDAHEGKSVWVLSNSDLSCLHDGMWTHFDQREWGGGIPRVLARGRGEGGEPLLWIGTSNGLAAVFQDRPARFDAAGAKLEHVPVRELLATSDSDGGPILWVGTSGSGLRRLARGKWTRFDVANGGLPVDFVLAMAEVRTFAGESELWVGTDGAGLVRIAGDQSTTFDTRNSPMASNFISALASPPNAPGTLWIGTLGGGIGRLRETEVGSYTARDGTLPEGAVFPIVETREPDGLAVWVGTENGLAKLSKAGVVHYTTANSKLTNNNISALAVEGRPDGEDDLWVGSVDGSIAHLASGRWVDTPTLPIPPDTIAAILPTRSSTGARGLLIATVSSGLCRYEAGKWSFEHATPSTFPSDAVTALRETVAPDSTSDLWVGTDKGAARRRGESWTVYNSKNGALGANPVQALLDTRGLFGDHTIWIATSGGGLSACDADAEDANGSCTVFGTKTRPALPSDLVYGIEQDQKGRLYVLTSRGVARITALDSAGDEPPDWSVETFGTEDGLPSDECGAGASLLRADGTIWVGTARGVAVFEAAKGRPHAPSNLLLERAIAGGAPLDDGAILPHDGNNLRVELALQTFHREAETRFRVELDGFDERPLAWSSDGKTNYTNLFPGPYTLRAWGRDYAGIVTGPVTVSFTVLAAPWRTPWAYALYAGALALIVASLVRLRLEVVERRNRDLDRRVRQRTAELAHKNEELVASHKRADRIFSALAEVLPGSVLDGKYSIEKKVGAGGSATVFRARHLGLDRDVAVKVFRPTAGNDSAESLERFRREGLTAGRVSHPNVVQVIDAGISADGIAYIAMELLDGKTLKEELAEVGRLSLRRAAEIIAPVCDAIASAHEAGLAHRDIKPENIFLTRGERGEQVKLLDFGIAKALAQAGSDNLRTETGIFIGTPAYMAPERFDGGEAYDARSDVYSLGIVLYEMIAGRTPYADAAADGLMTLIAQIADAHPAQLSDLAPNVPSAIEVLVMRSISATIEERPSARELLSQLAQIVSSLPDFVLDSHA